MSDRKEWMVELPVTGKVSVRVVADDEESALESARDYVSETVFRGQRVLRSTERGVLLEVERQSDIDTSSMDSEEWPMLTNERAVQIRGRTIDPQE